DELAQGLPAAVTLACNDSARAATLANDIGSAGFRLYLSDDVLGAEIGGVIKNVLAIACGIVSGQNLGENARAAIITRGFSEMQRLGAARGAKPDTLSGLCGLGDLILTCTSTRSRNFALGQALGQGQSAAAFLGARASVSEGAFSATAVHRLAQTHNVEMPICAAVAAIIDDGVSVAQAIATLLARPTTYETNETNETN
ncbi:MAG: NAD(P)H-dependent glycerol-3-phosphate dehydrogenase, partial [Alphaproteobacteria bacterium]|nr:NAD(P)H-dependent glycerol-3-phosphate dehydrogenase [Alphaproteobacteria bacterium]